VIDTTPCRTSKSARVLLTMPTAEHTCSISGSIGGSDRQNTDKGQAEDRQKDRQKTGKRQAKAGRRQAKDK
jgi:hypothetical protein